MSSTKIAQNCTIEYYHDVRQKERLWVFITRCSEFELETVTMNRILPYYIYFRHAVKPMCWRNSLFTFQDEVALVRVELQGGLEGSQGLLNFAQLLVSLTQQGMGCRVVVLYAQVHLDILDTALKIPHVKVEPRKRIRSKITLKNKTIPCITYRSRRTGEIMANGWNQRAARHLRLFRSSPSPKSWRRDGPRRPCCETSSGISYCTFFMKRIIICT